MKLPKENPTRSRRDFIKSTAMGIGATAFMGLGSQKARATQFSEVTKWDYDAEVVILGTGGAGLVTAITACDLGADVLMLDKASEAHAGGNTKVSGQGSWCPTNFDDSVTYQKALNDGYPVSDDLILTFHKYTVTTAEWIEKMGGTMRIAGSDGEFSEFPGASSTVI